MREVHLKNPLPLSDADRSPFILQNRLILTAAAAVWIGCIAYILIPETFSPLRNDFSLIPYTDAYNGDNSEIIEYSADSTGISFRYRVGSSEHADVGFAVMTEEIQNTIDLRRFESVELVCDPEQSDRFNMTIYCAVPSYTLLNERFTQLYLMTEAAPKAQNPRIRISLNDFHTPIWWYTMNRISRTDLPDEIPWQFCTGFSFSNHGLANRGEDLSLDIRSIKLYHRRSDALAAALITAIAAAAAVIIRSRKRRTEFYTPTDLISVQSEERQKVVQFLGANYMIPELSIADVSEAAGITSARIRSLMKQEFQCTVSEYIIRIRMTEARRLLSETDRQIIEIARKVGYQQSASFAHIFKKENGCSPTEYRRTLGR